MANVWKTRALVRLHSGDLEGIPVEVTIDWGGVADHLAQRAYDSKGGRAVVLGGLVSARVRRTRFTDRRK